LPQPEIVNEKKQNIRSGFPLNWLIANTGFKTIVTHRFIVKSALIKMNEEDISLITKHFLNVSSVWMQKALKLWNAPNAQWNVNCIYRGSPVNQLFE
jgi:hypothetical protein